MTKKVVKMVQIESIYFSLFFEYVWSFDLSHNSIRWFISKRRNVNGVYTLFTTERHFGWGKIWLQYVYLWYLFRIFQKTNFYTWKNIAKRFPLGDIAFRRNDKLGVTKFRSIFSKNWLLVYHSNEFFRVNWKFIEEIFWQ